MTVKELSEFTGKQETTIRNWVRKAAAKNAELTAKNAEATPAYPADYSVNEVELILNESKLGQNAVLIIMENARRPKQPATTDMTGPLMAFMAQMQSQQEKFMTAVLERLDGRGDAVPPVPKKALAPPITDRKTLSRIVNKYAEENMDRDYSGAWHVLYDELYYRIGRRVYQCAKNRKISGPEYMEQEGLIETAYSVAVEIMGE